ncbi:endonuclease domain-containing 1 protein-like [Nothobranchius furzeri]|uniref:Endonuclease domain-containing 1 protein-like n=1 Tax=Nothobranchius furzeri TaxID=105023 RepID=A0A1A7ZG59_NOTFU|nr:endonuclease domain-containing 1 protein-like [Nothobranchius furzeri]KAF7203754.1 endonuclease domain-containing 1 protein-like [Nothobranchius furzeri]
MSCLWTSVLILISAAVWSPCVADVGDFDPCLHFFYKSWPPKGLEGTPICQRYNNTYHFATLYSRPRRSPWFSGYLYTTPRGRRPKASWKYEPQLAYTGADGNMMPFLPGPVDQNVVESQAVELDYINSTFTRGHLNPSLHHETRNSRSATFTLTNVVPQKVGSNDGPWEYLEQTVNKTLAAYCLGEAYIVTGIIPYKSNEPWIKNHRVAVPEYMWSAYCCPNYNHSLPTELKDAFPTFAAIGRNDPNSSEEIVAIDQKAEKQFRGYDVRQMSLETLETWLKDRFTTVISVFYEQCVHQGNPSHVK